MCRKSLRWGILALLIMAGAAPFSEAQEATVSFRNDVLPVLSRHGCASGSCHAKTDGQNGFALTIFSYDPDADYREIVHNARGRRVFPAAPEQSLIVLKATNRVDHEGGEMIKPGSEAEKTLLKWIEEGVPKQVADEPVLEKISVTPVDARYSKGETRPLAVTAHYSDESERNVTHLSEFKSPEEAFAKVDEDGKVTAGSVPGEGAITVRYLDKVEIAQINIPPDRQQPPSAYADLPVQNEIDRYAYERFQKMGILPSGLCTDSEFIRRATLDVIGRLPSSGRVRSFLADKDSGKRKKLIDELLSDENAGDYGDYWATKWGDLFRPNIQRVGVKPVYLLDDWIRTRFRENTPWDEFAREFVTAAGSSHQYGPIAVWRDKRLPEDMAEYVGRIFLGVRLDCARCHHHPSERWSQDDYYSMAAFFGSMKRKGQGISAPISGEPEFWWFEPGGEVKHPVTDEVMSPKPPDGPAFEEIDEKTDPRSLLADWMTAKENPYFAKAGVNRVWGELFGRGIVHPVDDFRASNPVTNEPLLDWLAADFASNGYDFKKLLRTIMNSRLYQLSSLPNETNVSDIRNFSRAYRRRLPAEVLLDVVSDLSGEPDTFQGLPAGSRAVQQWNNKLSSNFLDAFGRPNSSADCPCERDLNSSVVQALHLMNSRDIQSKLAGENSWPGKLAKSEKTDAEIIEEIYYAACARPPEQEEMKIASAYLSREDLERQRAIEDILWSLMNSAEFVFNH